MKTPVLSPRILKQNSENPRKKAIRRVQRRLKESNGIQSAGTLHRKGVPTIELYQSEEDPYSHAVRTRLSQLGLDFVSHTVSRFQGLKHKQLVEVGGKDQIPFLMDFKTGVKLYGSNAIIAYLENEYGDIEKGLLARTIKAAEWAITSRVDRLYWRTRSTFDKVANVRKGVGDTAETIVGSFRMIRRAIIRSRQSGSESL